MGAPEKRRDKRYKRRLRVVFEADGTRAGGYTTNVSAKGMQVTAAVVFPAGSRIRGRIELPDGKEIPLHALVRWAVKTQGTFSIMREKSMGLQLLDPVPGELMGLLEGAREEAGRIPDGAAGASRAVVPAAGPPAARPRPVTPPPATAAAAPPPRAAAPAPASPARAAAPAPPSPARTAAPAPPSPARAAAPAPAAAAPPRAAPTAGGAPGVLAVGCQGTALSSLDQEGPLTPTAAVALIEQATAAALEGRLPADQVSRGVGLTLTITDTEPLPVGSSVQAVAQVQSLAGNGRIVELVVAITALGRPVAAATHTRMLVRRRAG